MNWKVFIVCLIVGIIVNAIRRAISKNSLLGTDGADKPIESQKFIAINDLVFNNAEAQKIFTKLKSDYYSGAIIYNDEYDKLQSDIDGIDMDSFSKDLLSSLLFSISERDIQIGLPTSKIILRKNELVYWRGNAVIDKIGTISRYINYSGFKSNQSSFINGNMVIKQHEVKGKLRIGTGNLYLTNKRLVFVAENGESLTISISGIINYASYENIGVILTLSNRKPIIVTFPTEGYFYHNFEINEIFFEDYRISMLYALDKVFKLENENS